MSSIAKSILKKRQQPDVPESQAKSPFESTGIAKAIMGKKFKNAGSGDTPNQEFLSAESDETPFEDPAFERKKRIAEIMIKLK